MDTLLALNNIIDKNSNGDGIHPTAVEGLTCLKTSMAGIRMPSIYTPSVCIITQGRKRVLLGDRVYDYAPSQFLAASFTLPVIGEVSQASVDTPYLCLQIDLNPTILAEILTQSRIEPEYPEQNINAMFVGDTDSSLLNAVLHLARLLDAHEDVDYLAPLFLREVHYRLITGPYGARIVQIAQTGSYMQRIASAVQAMKENLIQPLAVPELASLANMSASSFHYHFKQVMRMSPLQYQKRLRLMEARRIMLTEQVDAAKAAYRVGYESSSQFSRDYSKLFGNPPVRDIQMINHGSYG